MSCAFHQTFPREQSGLDYGLNWSLADDEVTVRGKAYRNAPRKTLLQHAVGTVDKATGTVSSTVAVDKSAPLYSTDDFPGFEIADIDAFEERRDKVGVVMRVDLLFLPMLVGHTTRLCIVAAQGIPDGAARCFRRGWCCGLPPQQ